MFNELKEIITTQFKIDPEKITEETNLRRDLGVNSIELAELVLEIEDKYDCDIDEKALSKLTSVGDMAKYLEKELG